MKKKTIIILSIAGLFIVGAVLIYLWSSGGITKKGQWERCYEVCYDLMITNTYKQACDEQCTEETGYSPTAAEVNEARKRLEGEDEEEVATETNKNTASKTSANADVGQPTMTNTKTNVNTETVDPEDRQYYCEWSWPQKIIDKDTKEVIKACTFDTPWCNKADGTYEKIGCCADQEHTDCILLEDLL